MEMTQDSIKFSQFSLEKFHFCCKWAVRELTWIIFESVALQNSLGESNEQNDIINKDILCWPREALRGLMEDSWTQSVIRVN